MTITRNKWNYLPGMISLMIIPYLISFLAIKYLEIPQERVMMVRMPDKYSSEPNFKFDHIATEAKIDFLVINLTGNDIEDKVKLDFAALETRRILKENDSVHGIKIIFADLAKYNSLVRILNIMDQEIARYYVYEDQAFWFYHIPEYFSPTYLKITPFECGSSANNLSPKPEFPWYIFNDKLFWIPCILVILAVFSIVMILQRIRSGP